MSAAAGQFVPVIDRNRCEGKGPCVAACPHAVLAIGVLERDARRQLNFSGRIKGLAHGYRQAFIVAAHACQACGACVRVCPEGAIKRKRAEPAGKAEPSAASRRRRPSV